MSSKLIPNSHQIARLNSAMDTELNDEELPTVTGSDPLDTVGSAVDDVGSGTGSSSEAEMSRLVEEQRLVVNKLAKRQRARDREALRMKINGLKSELAKVDVPCVAPTPVSVKKVNKDAASASARESDSCLSDARPDTKHIRRTFWVSDPVPAQASGDDSVGNDAPKVKDSTGLLSSIIARSNCPDRAEIAAPSMSTLCIKVNNNGRVVTAGGSHSLILDNIHVNPVDKIVPQNNNTACANLKQNVLQESYRINAAHSIPRCDSESDGQHVQRHNVRENRTPTGREGSSDSFARSESSVRSRNKPPKRGKNHQSGMLARSTDTVRYPQDWPHIALKSDRIGGAYSFHDLDAKSFMTGELELVTRSFISETEHDGRLQLLKQLMHLSRVYEWATILKLYTEVLSDIEIGLLTWASNFEPTLTWALNKYGPGPSKASGKTPAQKGSGGAKSSYKARPNFCKDFQSNSCSFSDEKHWGNVRGERVQVEHICASCLIKRKVTAPHSENSSDCPCKNSN